MRHKVTHFTSCNLFSPPLEGRTPGTPSCALKSVHLKKWGRGWDDPAPKLKYIQLTPITGIPHFVVIYLADLIIRKANELTQELVDACARELLEVVPQIMQSIRCGVRKSRASDLSVPQLRTLAFLNTHPGSPLNALAEHLGLTSPSAFSLVEGLLARGLLDRMESTRDRRRVSLDLTPAGRAELLGALHGAQALVNLQLSGLDAAELNAIHAALRALRPLFGAPAPAVLEK